MDETVAFRPEYLEAVAASRWNLWLWPLFLSAPVVLLVAVFRRWHWAVLAVLALGAAVATWFSLWNYSETIWTTMEKHAYTAAELDDVGADTGRVFGPFLVGVPFSVIYSAVSVAMAFLARLLWQKIRRKGTAPPPLPAA